MMKKGLIALLLTLPMLLTSCLNGSDSEPDPMGPGISIYNAARVKNQLAMVPADAGIRLLMLLEEADKRGLTDDRLDVKVDDVLLRHKLFTSDATITQNGTKYTLVFRKGGQLYYEGTVEVETNGTSLSDDNFEWTITTSGLKADVNTGLGKVTYSYSDEGTTEFSEGLGLEIMLTDIWLRNSENDMLNGWSGKFSLQGASSWAYSDCHEKEFKLNGDAKDSGLSWEVKNLRYKGVENTLTGQMGSMILAGEVNAAFTSNDYDKEMFPSPFVKIVFSNDGKSYTITYNGVMVTR